MNITPTFAFLAIFFLSFVGPIFAFDAPSHISQYGDSVWPVQGGYFRGMLVSLAQPTSSREQEKGIGAVALIMAYPPRDIESSHEFSNM